MSPLAIASKRLAGPPSAGLVVGGDRAAEGDPAARPQGAEGRFEVGAADVVEVDVDPRRRQRRQLPGDVSVAVGEGAVGAQLLAQELDLGRRAGAGDDRVAAQLGDLNGEAADGAGGAGDEDDVPGAQAGDVEEARVGGQADPAEGAQVALRRGRLAGLDRGRPARPAVGGEDRELAPAARMQDLLAGPEPGGPRLDHGPHGPAVQRAAQLEARQVLGAVLAHPDPGRGVDRHPAVADQDLVLARPPHRCLDQAEVLRPRQAPGPRRELDLGPPERQLGAQGIAATLVTVRTI